MAAAGVGAESDRELPLQAVSSRTRLEGLDESRALGGLADDGGGCKKRVRFDEQGETESADSISFSADSISVGADSISLSSNEEMNGFRAC